MATSYLSLSDIAVRGAETGFAKGVGLEHEDYQLSQNAERENFREKMLTERYALQLKNQLAEKSIAYAHEAEKISNMTSAQAAVRHNTELVKTALGNIDQQVNEAKTWLLPANRNNISNPKDAENFIADAQQRRLNIASVVPKPGNNGYIDQSDVFALTQPSADRNGNPISFVPQLTASYQAMQQSKLAREQALTEGTLLRNDKLKNPAVLSGKDIQKAQNEFAENIYGFNGLYSNVDASSKPLTDLYSQYGAPVVADQRKYTTGAGPNGQAQIDAGKWQSESPFTHELATNEKYQDNGVYNWRKAAIDKTMNQGVQQGDPSLFHSAVRQYNTSRDNFIKSKDTQAVLSKLGNPFYTGSDVAGFVQSQKQKFGNFKSYENVNSFLNYISNIKDTPTKEGSYAKALDGILSGNFAPAGSSGDETDQDNTDEMAPPSGGQEQQ